jgi:hypothetical protein
MSGNKFCENKFKIATILPVDQHGGHKVGPIVFILFKNIAKCKDMPYGRRSVEIENSKWNTRTPQK